MRRFALIAAATLLLVACDDPSRRSAAGPTPPEHIGLWYSEAASVDDRELRGDALITITSDGRFSAAFRLCTTRGQQTSTETGTWSIDGDIETATTQTVDDTPVAPSDYYVERYRLTWIDADTLDKTSEKDGETYRGRRVQAGFTPPPDPCPR